MPFVTDRASPLHADVTCTNRTGLRPPTQVTPRLVDVDAESFEERSDDGDDNGGGGPLHWLRSTNHNDGLVEFVNNPRHRRSKLVRLTRDGEARYREQNDRLVARVGMFVD